MDSADDYASSRSKQLPSGPALSLPSAISSKDANPATELLQDMIREKRAETQRAKKTYDPLARMAGGDKSDRAARDVQSSPSTAASARGRPSMGTRRTSGANGKPMVQKEMGLREMSEHISKVDKQNFDLKLEVFHRRQQNEILEAKVEDLEARGMDYEDLQAKYEALLMESDRQRLVLDDAVAQICELQGENEELQAMIGGHFAGLSSFESVNSGERSESLKEVRMTTPATPQQDSGRSTRPDPPERQSSGRSMRLTTSKRNLKIASPPREEKTKVTSLHSLYPAGDSREKINPSLLSVNRPSSVFSGDEEEDVSDRQMLNSPRLSILSESGFSSIYGNCKDNNPASNHTDKDLSEDSPSPSRREKDPSKSSAHRDARIDRWIQEKQNVPTPTTQTPKAGASERFTSIEQVLHKLPDLPSEHGRMPAVQIPQRQSSSAVKADGSQGSRKLRSPTKASTRREISLSSSNGSMTFGGKLPPTPDTMSSATIGGPSSSTQSIITEKSLLDHSQPPGKGYANLLAYGRPRTSDSDSPRSTKTTHNGLDGLGFGDEIGSHRPREDDDLQSTGVQQGDHGLSTASPFMGRIDHQDSPTGVTTSHVRPALMTHQTDMFFNGEGFALVQPSRTLSYPTPGRISQQSSSPLSPSSQRSDRSRKSSRVNDKVAHQFSPKKLSDAQDSITTPTKTFMKDDQAFSSAMQNTERGSPLSSLAKQVTSDSATIAQPKTGRFAFFRRSNSQNATVLLGSENTLKSRPPIFRSSSSTRTQSRPAESKGRIGKAFSRNTTNKGFHSIPRIW